jgi:hypothetical protein
MPLEGHWRRTNTPLRKLTHRERNAALAVLAATFVGLAILLLATAGDTRPGPAPGCIRATVAGRTGGEVVHPCGAEAIAVCRHAAGLEGPYAESVTSACVDARIKH